MWRKLLICSTCVVAAFGFAALAQPPEQDVTITITLPAAHAQQVIDDFIASTGIAKSDKINGEENPLKGHEAELAAKLQFVQDRLLDQIIAGASRAEANRASKQAIEKMKATLKAKR